MKSWNRCMDVVDGLVLLVMMGIFTVFLGGLLNSTHQEVRALEERVKALEEIRYSTTVHSAAVHWQDNRMILKNLKLIPEE